MFGHDPGAMRYSPLKQINSQNVQQLKLAWQFDSVAIATAGGLVFIGATVDGKFRAFDSRTGRELWKIDLGVDVNSIPVTWKSKKGKQYVAIFASGGTHGDAQAGRLLAYCLP